MTYSIRKGTPEVKVPSGTKGMNPKKQRREETAKAVPHDVNGPGVKTSKMKQSKRFEG